MLNQFLINGYLGCFQSFAITKAFLSVQKMIDLWVYVQGYLEGKSGNFFPFNFPMALLRIINTVPLFTQKAGNQVKVLERAESPVRLETQMPGPPVQR